MSSPLCLATLAMGTRFELVFDAPDREQPIHNRSQLRAIGEEVLEEMHWWHAALSAYEPSSTVCELMRRAGTGRPLSIDPRLRAVLRYGEHLRSRTLGAVDLCWRTRRDGPDDTIELPEHGAHLSRPGQSLDLGCVGKGLALDAACTILREHRVQRALLHGGTSSILAIGSWPIAVRLRVDVPPRRLVLENAHCSVSSNVHRPHLLPPSSETRSSIDAACIVVPLGACADHRAPWPLGEGSLAEFLSTTLVLTSNPTHLPPEAIHLVPPA